MLAAAISSSAEEGNLSIIEEFHFHTYFLQNNESSRAEAYKLRSKLEDLIAKGYANIVLNKMNEGPRGPHLIGSFETWCTNTDLSKMISFFMLNHGTLSILLHPLTRHEKLDHTTRAMWLGHALPLDLSVLQDDLGRIPSQKPISVIPQHMTTIITASPPSSPLNLSGDTTPTRLLTRSASDVISPRSSSPREAGRDRPHAAVLQRSVFLEGLPEDATVLELSEAFTTLLKETPGFVRLRLLEKTTACVEFRTVEQCVPAVEKLKQARFRGVPLRASICVSK